MSVNINLTPLEIGSSYLKEFIYLEPDNVTPIDLTGCFIDMEVRASLLDANYYLRFTSNDKITITPLEGKFVIELDDQDTKDYIASPDKIPYVYGIRIHFSNGFVDPVIKGTWKFEIFPNRTVV